MGFHVSLGECMQYVDHRDSMYVQQTISPSREREARCTPKDLLVLKRDLIGLYMRIIPGLL